MGKGGLGGGGWLKKLPTVFNCCENTVYSRTRGTVKIFIYSTALLKFYISTTIALTRPRCVSVLMNVYRRKTVSSFPSSDFSYDIFKACFKYVCI